jgi:HK97 family phage major capsid protein
VDAIDLNGRAHFVVGDGSKPLIKTLEESENLSRLMRDRKGSAVIQFGEKEAQDFFERKTTVSVTAAGVSTSGVIPFDRTPGIVQEARQQLFLRDALTSRPTLLPLIDFVKVNTPMTRASPQIEASDKFENAITFTTKSERVRTLATIIPATRQVLDDMTELAGFIDTSMRYYVNLSEEIQMLSGSGTGEDLDGFITQATPFNTALLSATAGWNKIDIIGRAIQQVTVAKELQPTFIVMHYTDWWGIRLTKDGFGRYILGDPQEMVSPTIFGLDVVSTTSIASGTFLVGSGSPVASEIRDRMELTVEVSTEHSDYFAKNLVAIRAEKRLALVVYRPGSYVTGSFTTSP